MSRTAVRADRRGPCGRPSTRRPARSALVVRRPGLGPRFPRCRIREPLRTRGIGTSLVTHRRAVAAKTAKATTTAPTCSPPPSSSSPPPRSSHMHICRSVESPGATRSYSLCNRPAASRQRRGARIGFARARALADCPLSARAAPRAPPAPSPDGSPAPCSRPRMSAT